MPFSSHKQAQTREWHKPFPGSFRRKATVPLCRKTLHSPRPLCIIFRYPGLAKFGIAPALGAGDRGFESRSPDQRTADHFRDPRSFLLRSGISTVSCEQSRFPALGKKQSALPVADEAGCFLAQRSKKSRIRVSPMIFSGTASRRRSRGDRGFESRSPDQKSTSFDRSLSILLFHFSLFTFHSSLTKLVD